MPICGSEPPENGTKVTTDQPRKHSYGWLLDDKRFVVANLAPPSIPVDVRAAVNRYLGLIDAALPGRIEGLYLVGSTALGDYRSGQSDVDFVAVTGDLLTADERDRLRSLHACLLEAVARPYFDGIYVTWKHLQQDPSTCEDVPFSQEGAFKSIGGFEANPSTWLTLARYPLAVRGPAAPSVWHDTTGIRQWNIDNLNSYWRGLVQQGRSAGSKARALTSEQAINRILLWCVSGVARLHYALATFPDTWQVVINEALTLRRGEQPAPRSRWSRRRDVLGFMEFVIDDANARAGDGQ